MKNLFRKNIEFETKKTDIKNITGMIEEIVEESGVKNGLCHVYFTGTTGGIVINENDTMLKMDIKSFFEIVEENKNYYHNNNAHSHLRAMLGSTEKAIPVVEGRLALGQWQNILFCEFDIRPRTRKIIVTVFGE